MDRYPGSEFIWMVVEEEEEKLSLDGWFSWSGCELSRWGVHRYPRCGYCISIKTKYLLFCVFPLSLSSFPLLLLLLLLPSQSSTLSIINLAIQLVSIRLNNSTAQ